MGWRRAGRGRRRLGRADLSHRGGRSRRPCAAFGKLCLLQAPDLLLKLLVAELQLLHRAGELANLVLHALEAHDQLGRCDLRAHRRCDGKTGGRNHDRREDSASHIDHVHGLAGFGSAQ